MVTLINVEEFEMYDSLRNLYLKAMEEFIDSKVTFPTNSQVAVVGSVSEVDKINLTKLYKEVVATQATCNLYNIPEKVIESYIADSPLDEFKKAVNHMAYTYCRLYKYCEVVYNLSVPGIILEIDREIESMGSTTEAETEVCMRFIECVDTTMEWLNKLDYVTKLGMYADIVMEDSMTDSEIKRLVVRNLVEYEPPHEDRLNTLLFDHYWWTPMNDSISDRADKLSVNIEKILSMINA